MCCQDNNLSLNVIKTKDMIVDYRKKRNEHAPITINGAAVEQFESFKFLGVHITNKLTWFKHTKRYRSTKSRSKKLLNNFFPQAIRLLNILSKSYPDHSCFAAYSLLLSSMHSHFNNSTYMYILPQLP